MPSKDQTVEEFMQEVLPGSKTFTVKLLCPCCGWHFKHGVTDPTGEAGKLVDGAVLVCGQCLHTLMFTDGKGLVALTTEQIEALEPGLRAAVAETWKVAYFALMLAGPEPKGPVQ